MIELYCSSRMRPSICVWFISLATFRSAGRMGSTRLPPAITPMVSLRRSQ